MSFDAQEEQRLRALVGRVEQLENDLDKAKEDIKKQVSESGDTMSGGLSITSGDSPLLDLNPSSSGEQDVINITPVHAVTGIEWDGIKIDGKNLDPSAVEADIHGIDIDLSGVDETYAPHVDGLVVEVPPQNHAIHIEEGELHVDYTTDDEAMATYTGIDMNVKVNQTNADLQSTSMFHGLDVAIGDGTPAGEVAAIGTHPGVDPVHQHIGTFATPSKTEYAARWPFGGSWTDEIDGHEIFVANADAVYIGHTAKFDELEVIMATKAIKDVKPLFYFYDADSWEQFYPADDTNGFTQDGLIRWASEDLTNWKSDYDPGGDAGSAGYYIKIVRNRVSDPGSPTPTTIKYLVATTYKWDSTGKITSAGITLGATTAVTGILDEDNMASDSAVSLSTQQAIKKYVDDNAGGGSAVGARVYNDTAIETATGEWVELTFNSERFDTDDIHSTSSNTGRLTCKTAGKYGIIAQVAMFVAVNKVLAVAIKLNNTTQIAIFVNPADTASTLYSAVSTHYDLAVDDYVEVEIFHNNVAATDIISTGNYSPEFSMMRFGA